MSSPPRSNFLRRYPDFARFWFARLASAAAFQMHAVAAGWQMYELTHSTFMLGMVGLAEFLPMVLLMLWAGHAADRNSRRRIVLFALLIQAVAIGCLAYANATGRIRPSLIFVAVAIIGAARAFERPSTQALLPALVPAGELPRAVAWSTGGFQVSSIASPALGGVLYAMGATVPYAVAAALALVGAVRIAAIRHRPPRIPREPPTLHSLFGGIGFIRHNPIILGSISLDLFAVLLGGATALLPAFAHDILHVGAWGMGALRGAPAVGSLLMSGYLLWRPLKRRVGRKMFVAVFAFGLATIVFGLSRSFTLSLFALTALGAADVISVVIRTSLVQLRTPDAMRGRVNAVNALFVGTSNQLGEFESGVTASLLGTAGATVIGGIGTVVVAALWMWFFPDLRSYDRLEETADANSESATPKIPLPGPA